MKVIILLGGFIAIPAVLLAKIISPFTPVSQNQTSPNTAHNRSIKAYQSFLPQAYQTPAQLPSKIQDPLLLTAWLYLYNQQEPIEIHDGIIVTGRTLAQFALENDIAVVWNPGEICNGTSCARRYICSTQACLDSYTSTEPQIIYLTPELQDNTPKSFGYLIKTLAHELYHLTLPFGPVATSLYEEYWAFYIGTQVSKTGWMEFDLYDPLKAVCLERWFLVYGLERYDNTEAYPVSLPAQVDQTSVVCTPAS